MRKRSYRFLAFSMMAVFSFILTECSKSKEPTPEASTSLDPSAPTPAIPPISGQLPASISEAYRNAEQIFESTNSADWPSDANLTVLKMSVLKVRSDLDSIASLNDLRARVVRERENLIDSHIASLEGAIRSGDRLTAKRECNRTTQPIAELARMNQLCPKLP